MTAYRFSRIARLDLIKIADKTLDHWGSEQAVRYIDSLQRCFGLIPANPEIGLKCDRIRKHYRRIEHEKHVVFYRARKDGILIVRILHQRVMPENQQMDENE